MRLLYSIEYSVPVNAFFYEIIFKHDMDMAIQCALVILLESIEKRSVCYSTSCVEYIL